MLLTSPCSSRQSLNKYEFGQFNKNIEGSFIKISSFQIVNTKSMVLFQFRATDTRQLQIDGLCVFLCCVYVKDKNKIYSYTTYYRASLLRRRCFFRLSFFVFSPPPSLVLYLFFRRPRYEEFCEVSVDCHLRGKTFLIQKSI